jgi:LacI family transcriptional regulator
VKEKSSMPTVADVARVAGVGAITVSRFVNGTSYVSAEKQKKIQSAINKLGYRPNQAARILKGQRSKVIGLIIPDLADPFFGKCASAIENYAYTRGYMTLIVTSKRTQKIRENEIAMMIGQQIAGLIVTPSHSHERLLNIAQGSVPIVALDRPLEGIISDEVVVENMGGAQTAVDHLIWHGHKRIACVGYDKNSYSISHRILGYTMALQAARLKPEIYGDVQSLEDAVKIVRQWKKSRDRPTAIFALNNVSTRHLLEALRVVDLPIPGKMALVGFDDFELAGLLSPSLTVVRQPATGLGLQAARILFERIDAGDQLESSFGIKLVLPVEFVIRNSCGCTGPSKKI